jgi:hypothetical protein
MVNTIARRFYNSLGIYTVAFALPAHTIVWANQYARQYLFPDGSTAIVGSNTNGKAVWAVSFGDTVKQLIGVKLVNVLPQYRK